MSDQHIDYSLIWKKINGVISHDEDARLQQWMDADPANREYAERVLTGAHTKPEALDVSKEEGWQRLQGSIGKPKHSIPYYRYAAVITLLLGCLFLVYQVVNSSVDEPVEAMAEIVPGTDKAMLLTSSGQTIDLGADEVSSVNGPFTLDDKTLSYKNARAAATEYNTLVVPRGGKFQVELSDSTRVWVNSDSRLTYPVSFGEGNREVELVGEAYFEVAHDKSRPFIVTSRDQKTTVLGTSFNVSAYSDQLQVITTLVEGKVQVDIKNRHESMILNPSHQSVYDGRSGEVTRHQVDVATFTAWKDNLFVFENESLANIMTTLSRWYDVDVFFENDQAATYRFTGEVDRYENIEGILGLIEKTNAVRFEIRSKAIIVK